MTNTSKHDYDVVVVGGGTGGSFAAATAANEGMNTVLIERKSEEEAGHIACGDALKGEGMFPDVIDRKRLRDESFTNENITQLYFENPDTDEILEIPFGGQSGAIIDRKRYGEILLDEA
ncbi:MAG: FAD-dependent oxidoreductase, partial [Halobacteria archaeon]|nr:FAD-dependent oxidoreductase [Halobacteria archaeon]